MEICDLGVIGFVAYKGGVEPHGGYIRNINRETRGKLIGIGSRRVVCNADFLGNKKWENNEQSQLISFVLCAQPSAPNLLIMTEKS